MMEADPPLWNYFTMAIGSTFGDYMYTSDAGKKYRIRLSNAVALVLGNSVAITNLDDGNVSVGVQHHGQKRRTGIQARGIVIGKPATAPATGYSSSTFVPLCLATDYAAAAKGQTITYSGSDWKIRDKVPEV